MRPPTDDRSASRRREATWWRSFLSRPGPTSVLNVALLALATAALMVLALQDSPDPGVEVERRDPPPGVDEIVVDVRGAVVHPGLVTAGPDDRVADIIERAGGALPDADLDTLNLALRVRDEDRIRVPFVGENVPPLLDLNSATRADLEALPGIGPARAAAIIEARPLRSVDDLVDRSLVPASVWEEIRTLVTVR